MRSPSFSSVHSGAAGGAAPDGPHHAPVFALGRVQVQILARQRDIRRDLGNHDRDPDAVHLDERSTNTHLGPFIQDEIEIGRHLRINAGLRYDHASAAGSDLSPRAALSLLSAARAWAFIDGRAMVMPEDVQAVLPSVACHRLQLASSAGHARPEDIAALIRSIPVV